MFSMIVITIVAFVCLAITARQMKRPRLTSSEL